MKTVNLELSKQLKEAGYPQREGKFFWFENSESDIILMDTIDKSAYFAYEKQCFASPTADEILEKLPPQLKGEVKDSWDYHSWDYPWLICTKNKAKEWEVGYATDNGFENGHMRDKELANACAKLWLYLKENNLVSSTTENRGKE